MNDLKFAFRQLAKNPGFTAVAVLTLALGIGATTTIFSMVNAILLRPLPFKEAERLVMVFTASCKTARTRTGWPRPRWVNGASRARCSRDSPHGALTGLSSPAKASPRIFLARGFPRTSSGCSASSPFWDATFFPEETYGKDHVVLLSHELWVRRFGADLTVLGRDITLNEELYRVIGVMPPHTFFPEHDTQLWAPLAFSPEQSETTARTITSSMGASNPGSRSHGRTSGWV